MTLPSTPAPNLCLEEAQSKQQTIVATFATRGWIKLQVSISIYQATAWQTFLLQYWNRAKGITHSIENREKSTISTDLILITEELTSRKSNQGWGGHSSFVVPNY